jgi:RNA polymerase sigma factor (sigma-70 family)
MVMRPRAAALTGIASYVPRSTVDAVQAGSSESAVATQARYRGFSDPALVEACLGGDDLAWHTLTERYGPLVYTIPRRLGLSAADADDVFQNVFTIVFRRLGSLRSHQSLAAWLITIARRECIHHFKRTPDHDDLLEELADTESRLSDYIERREQQLLVHRALGELDPPGQALLSALFLEVPTPSYAAIARRLGMAVGSIGPARARSLKKLAAVLHEMLPDAFGSPTAV